MCVMQVSKTYPSDFTDTQPKSSGKLFSHQLIVIVQYVILGIFLLSDRGALAKQGDTGLGSLRLSVLLPVSVDSHG